MGINYFIIVAFLFAGHFHILHLANPWAVNPVLIIMPVSIVAVESPLYIGYDLPKLIKIMNRKCSAILIASSALAFQHIAIFKFNVFTVN